MLVVNLAVFRIHYSPQTIWRVNLAGSGNRLESELVRKGCVSSTLLSAKWIVNWAGPKSVSKAERTERCGGRDLRYPQVWKANLSGLGARLESEAH